MRFRQNPPTKTGRYWYVDTEFPIPRIGFYHGGRFYQENRADGEGMDIHHYFIRNRIRYGDRIQAPTVEIEK